MKYEVVVAQGAINALAAMDAGRRSQVKQALLQFLVHEPKKESKSRIKRLRGLRQPQYRLRVQDVRVFYDVDDELRRVEVLAVVVKSDSGAWLELHGEVT